MSAYLVTVGKKRIKLRQPIQQRGLTTEWFECGSFRGKEIVVLAKSHVEADAIALDYIDKYTPKEEQAAAAADAKLCPSCGAEMQLHPDGEISEPMLKGYMLRDAPLERRYRKAAFYGCPSCEHCEEVEVAPVYSDEIVAAFHRLVRCQTAVHEASGRFLGPTVSASARKRSGLKAAQTKASKAFSRVCYAAGFHDAQAVADALTKREEHATPISPAPLHAETQAELGQPEASNFVVDVNGHKIYRAADGLLCNLWTAGVGWWGFDLPEDEARSVCTAVSAKAVQ